MVIAWKMIYRSVKWCCKAAANGNDDAKKALMGLGVDSAPSSL